MNNIRTIIKKHGFRTILGISLGFTASYAAYSYINPLQIVKTDQSITDKIELQTTIVDTNSKNTLQNDIKTKVNEQTQDTSSVDANQKSNSVNQEQTQKVESNTTRKQFKFLSDVALFKKEGIPETEKRVIIVGDLPYNEQFQARIIKMLNEMSKRFGDITIYRADLTDKAVQSMFENMYKAKVQQKTIFVLKNPYEKGVSNIDFDIFVQFPHLVQTYLKDVQHSTLPEVMRRISNLSPYESTLVYLYDEKESPEKVKERMLAAKYIDMQMSINNLNGVKLEVVEKNASVAAGLVDPENARTNSVHLFRKHNIYTPQQPNFWFPTQDGHHLPFFRLSDIGLFAKGSKNMLIANYLSNLQSFDAMSNPAPYLCTLKVDRNKISEMEYNNLLRIFGQLKRNNNNSKVAFDLKLKQVGFIGKDYGKNRDWSITVVNVDQMDKESMLHQINNHKQAELLGFKENTYLRQTHQYFYPHSEVSYPLIKEFLQQAVQDKVVRHYKSEEEDPLTSIHKVVGSSFSKLLSDDKDHFVYEYSKFCPTCSKISPVVSAFSRAVKNKGLGLHQLQFHRFDANSNRIKGQLASPYIPNIFYYKNQWKKMGPVRFPIDLLGNQGLISLYAFCAITKEVKDTEWLKVDQAIASASIFQEELKNWF